MNLSSFYWTAPQVEKVGVKSQPLQERHYGFMFDIPHPDPSTVGWWFGEGQAYPGTRKELVYSPQPEYFAVDGIIGSAGGIPRYNPYDKNLQFKRSQVTQKF